MTASKGVTAIGALSWSIDHGHADGIDLSGLRTVLSIRYLDQVQPSTPWKVVLYVDAGADVEQRAALADIFLGRAGGTIARLYGPAIGEVCAVRPAASPWSTSRPASASTSSATFGSRPKATPRRQAMSGAASRALTILAPSSTAT